jgi:outer membrane protein OmpA-like peptidoglycan-associated protein
MRLWLVLGCFLCFSLGSFSQNKNTQKARNEVEKAAEAYQLGLNDKALKSIEKALKLDSTVVDAYLLLVDMAKDGLEVYPRRKALIKIIELSPYGNALASKLLAADYFDSGDFADALKHYLEYQNICPSCDSAAVQLQIESSRFAVEAMQNEDFRTLELRKLPEPINTSEFEYWPALSADDSILYFTRIEPGIGMRKVEKIYSAKRIDGGFETPLLEFEDQTNLVNRGAMSISADGKMLFYTACNQPGGKGSCDIYMVVKMDGKWSQPHNIGNPVNTAAWEAQPSVSADGRWLYFCSSRTGTLGGMDLWVSEILQPEKNVFRFSEPVNLGEKVNTPFDDFSPFIHANGHTLYFASKGWPRFGQADLFLTELGEDQPKWPRNLGLGINTRADEFGFTISTTGAHAYFSTDRDGTRDLYEFIPDATILAKPVSFLKGFVRNSKTLKHLDAKVEITNLGTNYTWSTYADPTEGYLLTLVPGSTYALNVVLEGYLLYSKHIDITTPRSYSKPQWFYIDLIPVEVDQILVLNNIFFNFNSAELRPESDVEIAKLIAFLQANPRVHIEIGGHTDNVGTDAYNQQLSEMRAKAIVDAVSKSIDPKRMSFKGYGALQPITPNDTEDNRALNRRSEVRITH